MRCTVAIFKVRDSTWPNMDFRLCWGMCATVQFSSQSLFMQIIQKKLKKWKSYT